ncbi:hypothetical protein HNP84_003928 [Thermocatellispora tengchongensis]|uniref:Uncharacterized protein n=1 Tax=Thermocatellispora tengchongensis TaxID=1073253 RepID=A0A840P4B3_9ACTN|nr:hypothetical protein [Thermocatellispora tengchongensis]MBB5134202.1 hypothetical protein [Thermocatellispora tengchongensis]
MIYLTIRLDETPSCACGAILARGQTRCRKCLARDRWLRKDAARRKARRRRRDSRRPPRDPRGIAQKGAARS